MKLYQAVFAVALSAGMAFPALASTSAGHGSVRTSATLAAKRPVASSLTASDFRAGSRAPVGAGKLECVPYARDKSGIQIFGDAHTWWNQARGRYATGRRPMIGAVMAIPPFNNSRLGHVATVSRIVDSRTILLNHANWSVPGGIERNVTALDVSAANDWSRVRIWYGPANGLGTTHWPVSGFIYNAKPGAVQWARNDAPAAKTSGTAGAPSKRRRSDPIGTIIAGSS